MDEQTTESSADAPRGPQGRPLALRPAHLTVEPAAADLAPEPPPERPRRRRRRWLVPLLLAPLVLLGLATIAWAVDTSSGGVARHVSLRGVEIGGLSKAELAAQVSKMADDFAATPVELVTDDATYSTTAAEIGLSLDEDRTSRQALDLGRDTFVLLRPFHWMRSFVVERDAEARFRVNDDQVATTVVRLEGDARTVPTEPTVELVDGRFHVVPGADGSGIYPREVARALPEAAASASVGKVIRVDVAPRAIPPLGSEAEAEAAAARAEALVSEPVEVSTSGGSRTISSEELRRWVTLASQPDGTVEIGFEAAPVEASLRKAFADVEGHPVDAGFTLQDGTPVIIPDRPGKLCCTPDSPERILTALRAGTRTVALDLIDGPASFTVAEAQAWRITQPVGGNQAWLNGAPTTAGPGFTTYHAPSGARVANIHRIADIVRGSVVPPGGTFSINDKVGKRTAEKGFVAAGAIRDGEHVDEIGGGISQFATTMFNAAYFAGLDITEYQAHSEYFDRYPRGREATMGFPAPDLAFKNNTPFGILIWTSYTSSSLTVTLYSSPFATAEQTAIKESDSGRCKVVVTTRTRTFPDGSKKDDTFRARYRPGPGEGC